MYINYIVVAVVVGRGVEEGVCYQIPRGKFFWLLFIAKHGYPASFIYTQPKERLSSVDPKWYLRLWKEMDRYLAHCSILRLQSIKVEVIVFLNWCVLLQLWIFYKDVGHASFSWHFVCHKLFPFQTTTIYYQPYSAKFN